jgi:hypothetical protein
MWFQDLRHVICRKTWKGFTSLLGGRYGQKSTRTGFFFNPTHELELQFVHVWTIFNKQSGASLVCVFYSCYCNCFLTAWKFFSQGGGVGEFQRVHQTHLLHIPRSSPSLLVFLCARNPHTQIAGVERGAAAAAGGGGGKL